MQGKRVLACLSLSWPANAASVKQIAAKHLEQLQATAAEIAAKVAAGRGWRIVAWRVGSPVKIDHAEDADNAFETLMGDVVEPRRDFIQCNALNVVNLDI